MNNYVKIFINQDEYDSNCNKPIISHLVDEIVIIFGNSFNSCQDGGCPPDGCCDLDGGYFF